MKIAERSAPAAGPSEFERAFHGRFRTVIENERHTVSGGNCDQVSLVFGGAELLRLAHHSIEHLQQAPLFVNQQSGVTDNIDEENVRDLQLDLFFDLSGHEMREGYCRFTDIPKLASKI
jgi:hypothetical protein